MKFWLFNQEEHGDVFLAGDKFIVMDSRLRKRRELCPILLDSSSSFAYQENFSCAIPGIRLYQRKKYHTISKYNKIVD